MATEGDLFLQLINPPGREVIVEEPTIEVVARTRVDAVATINDSVLDPDAEGRFQLTVELEEGPNTIEVVVSVASGEQEGIVLTVIYIP